MLAQLNDCIGGLLHLGPNVITFRALLHLGPNVITFRTLLRLGQLLHLGLQQLSVGKYCADGTTIFSSTGTKLNEVYFDRIAPLCLYHDDKKGHRCCAVALYAGEYMDHKLYLIRQLTQRPRFYGTFCSLRFRSEFSKYYLGMAYLCLLITS